jgi:hypothetical protein
MPAWQLSEDQENVRATLAIVRHGEVRAFRRIHEKHIGRTPAVHGEAAAHRDRGDEGPVGKARPSGASAAEESRVPKLSMPFLQPLPSATKTSRHDPST